MKTARVLTPFFPYPLREAAYQTIFNQILHLYEIGYKVQVVTWKDSPRELEDKLRQLPNSWPEEIEVISWHPGTGKVSENRLGRILRGFFGSLTSPEIYHYPPILDRRSELPPVDLEIYQYSFAWSWLRKKASTSSKTVVHFHNLEHELYEIRARYEGSLKRFIHRRTAKELKAHELQIPQFADEIWHHSPGDLQRFEQLQTLSEKIVQRVVPTTVRNDYVAPRWSSPLSANGSYVLGFIGGLDFEPNKQGFLWIIDELAPQIENIHRAGGARIKIVHAGKRSTEVESAAARYDFIEFMGFVEDIETWWSDLSFSLVPDFTGAGIRVKLLESLASKVPVLTTRQAVEKLPPSLRNIDGLFVSNSASDWVRHILDRKTMELRAGLRKLAFPADLDANKVYSFLLEGRP